MPESNEQVRAAREAEESARRLLLHTHSDDERHGGRVMALIQAVEARVRLDAEQRIERLETALREADGALEAVAWYGRHHYQEGDQGYQFVITAEPALTAVRAALDPAPLVLLDQPEEPIDETPDYVLGEHPEIDPGVLGAMQMFAAGKGEEVVEYVRTYHQCNYECSFPCTLAGI